MSQMNPIPYATPALYQFQGGVWREGGLMVMHKAAVLPDLCVKCGSPANGFRIKRRFFWHDPIYYWLILPGVLIYAIVAMCVRKDLHTFVPLCSSHRAHRRNGILFGWLGLLAGIAVMVAGIALIDRGLGLLILVGLSIVLAATVAIIIFARTLKPKKIDDIYAWLTGCGEPFLAQLPPIPH
jgi:hypothetical protein